MEKDPGQGRRWTGRENAEVESDPSQTSVQTTGRERGGGGEGERKKGERRGRQKRGMWPLCRLALVHLQSSVGF